MVIALGIVDGFKRLVLSRFEEKIEKRKFGINEKRDAREALLNIISWGQASNFAHFPAFNDIAHIIKMENKILSFDEDLATNIDSFLAYWIIYESLLVKKSISLDFKMEHYKKIKSLVNDLVPRINKLA